MSLLNYTFITSEGGDSVLFGEFALIWNSTIAPDAAPSGFALEDYEAQMFDLLPSGAAWPRDRSTALASVLASFAVELSRLDLRTQDLVTEADPRVSSELLADFERLLGLPDKCVTTGLTVAARRAAVQARLTNVGGQSRAFFLELASRLGYQITIDEFKTEAAAIAAGIPYTGTGWAHTWRINSAAQTVRDFRVGEATAGEALRTWGNEQLECSFNRLKPAHTVLLFAYA